jgi:hypothetical protein
VRAHLHEAWRATPQHRGGVVRGRYVALALVQAVRATAGFPVTEHVRTLPTARSRGHVVTS